MDAHTTRNHLQQIAGMFRDFARHGYGNINSFSFLLAHFRKKAFSFDYAGHLSKEGQFRLDSSAGSGPGTTAGGQGWQLPGDVITSESKASTIFKGQTTRQSQYCDIANLQARLH